MKRIFWFAFVGLFIIHQNSYSQKVGVVLSGGGAAGAAHVGVLKALEENEIPIDFIVGTSIGALVGGLYASGYSTSEIEAIFLSKEFQRIASGMVDPEKNFFFKKSPDNASILNFNFNIDSVFTSNLPTNFIASTPVDFELMEVFSTANAACNRNFDSLMIPFRCLAANITKRKEKIFRNGDLATAIRASMTYPFYIPPISIDGDMMFDGGIYNNFPVGVLCEEFDADFIIASNVAETKGKPMEDDLVSQLKGLLLQPTSFSIDCAEGIIINADVSDISTFDFYDSEEALEKGYINTYGLMDSIKSEIAKRRSYTQVMEKRKVFESKKPKLQFDQINFQGLDNRPAKYFIQSLNHDSSLITISELERAYFKLNSNEKIKSLYPKAKFNPKKGAFDLELDVKKRKSFNAAFGGVISTKPFSSGFFELGYQQLKATELKANGNIYFGNFYNSAEGNVRWDVPFDLPFYISSNFTINRFDFFGNGSFLIEENNPPFIIASERYWELNLGLPIFQKGKLLLGSSFFWQENEYHQTDDFLRTDTADFTEFNGYTNFIKYQMNTLNRKQYATKGFKLDVSIRHVFGDETTIPGTLTNLPAEIDKERDWIDISFKLDQYFLKQSDFHFGTTVHLNYTELPFFQNFTSTLLQANAFEPIVESRTRFIENLRARRFLGVGVKSIYSIRDFIDFRAEAYFFQPYRDFIRIENNDTDLSKRGNSSEILGTLTAVYHSRVGPFAVSLNYFDSQSPNLSFLVHFGYVIFNKKALE